MKKPSKIFNNIGLKILAVMFSALLWLISVNINDPVDTEVYRNIPVEMENTSLLTDEGMTYEVLDDTDRVTVTVRANRSVLENINASDVTATADFSELSFTNTVPIRLSISRSLGSQIEVTGSIDMVRLEVEERQERQLVIEIDQIGTPADGYIVSSVLTTDGNALRISGPQSLVSQVDRAVVEANVEGLTESINISEPIRLYDADGNEITSSRITKSVSTSNVSISILQTKEIPVTASASGEPADGYAATGEVTCAPDRITVAGRNNALANLTEIVIPADEVDLTDATEDVVELIDIREYLPDGVSLTNTSGDDFNGRVAVTAKVEPLVDMTRQMNQSRILLQNVPDGYQVTLDSQEAVSIRLRGLQADLNAIDVSQLSGTIDVSDWMQENGLTELTEGEMEMEVAVALPDNVTQIGTVTAVVNVLADTTANHGTAGEAAAAGTPESAAAGAAESAAAGTAAPANG
ncbi:MAG TPA: hypothetical protein H9744_13795 [Candidatus Eisenbergiella stercoravium]|mgnify:CR=1 FL=1|nr:hypothetical protein [Candidatus Eisenbergiella stercoravium]